MPLSKARGFHGNHEGAITTYDHVNSDGSQSVRGIQSLIPRNKFGSGAESEQAKADWRCRQNGAEYVPNPDLPFAETKP
jgi:hypothetical protein